MDLAAAVQDVVDRLKAGGIRATADGRDLNPPAVKVQPPVMTFRFGKGCWDAEWTAQLVVPDSGHAASLRALGPLITAVQDALGGAVVTARPQSVDLSDGAGSAPGYALTWTARIPA